MPYNVANEKSALIQVMAWCRQATSHYWANVDLDLCRHTVSLGHNELTSTKILQGTTVDAPVKFQSDQFKRELW